MTRAMLRRSLALCLLVISLAACGSTPTSSVPSGTPASLQSSCSSDIPQSICQAVINASLASVASSGWTPSQIWVSDGQLCPTTLCVFDPDQNFPYPATPSGGQWIGSAEVAFAQTDQHAGLNIAQVGGKIVPVLIGYRVPLLSWCSGYCSTASAVSGKFKLELSLPHLDWKAGDPISGSADFEVTDNQPATVYGAAELIGYSYHEVDGTRGIDPIWDLSCSPYPLDPPTPINVALDKSGAVTATGSDALFQEEFLADPEVRLPAGIWDITAIASFSEGGCSATSQTLNATLRVTVTP